MTDQEILEGNKLIAEFMTNGKTFRSAGGARTYAMHGGFWKKDALRFHESWDWLMSVVEKIEESKSNEGNFEIYIFKRCCDIQTEKGDDHIIEVTAAENKMQAVWVAVVSFIKIWNTKIDNPSIQ